MKKLLILLACAALAACTSDSQRLDKVEVDGVDCVITRDGLGRAMFADCDWT